VAAAIGGMALCLALRLIWLDRLPGINGDEAWYGVQVQRLMEGTSWSGRTPTGLPTNPLLIVTHWSLLQFCEPSFWVLRLPIAIWSAVGLVLTGVFYRVLYGDRTESLVVIFVTACLPAHLAYSRFCWDSSFAFVSFPLFIFPLLRVIEGHRNVSNVSLFIAGSVLTVWVHATHALLVVAGFVVLMLQYKGAILAFLKRRPFTSLALAAVAVLIAWWAVRESYQLRILLQSVISSVDRLPQHLAGLSDVMLGPRVYRYLAGTPEHESIVAGRIVFYILAAAFLGAMWIRGPIGDRKLVLVAVLTLLLVFLAGRMLRLHRESYERYILYLVPFLGLIIVRGTRALVAPTGLAHARVIHTWLLLALSFFFLIQSWRAYFEPLRDAAYAAQQHRTFRSDSMEPKAAAAAVIREYSAFSPVAIPVFVEDWWVQHALDYLLDNRWSVWLGLPPRE
jgi:hypothetical protein